jgi:ketosteroid isomerase-like protein
MTFADEAQRVFDAMVVAYRAGDAAGCAALFTADAILLSPYAHAARGRAAIEALHHEWTSDGGSEGDLGWCLAAYSEGDGSGDGTSLRVLERQPDGRWLISSRSLTSDEPPYASTDSTAPA